VDTTKILAELDVYAPLPTEALREASAARDALIPIFLEAFDEHAKSGASRLSENTLFFAFHLLGEWRDASAYRPLARFLRSPRAIVEPVLGGAITETVHRVMVSVFDGDPVPLQEIIGDSNADEFVRSRMIHAIFMLTRSGEIPRQAAAEFLRDCHRELHPRESCFVWCGWQDAIAWLGLAELRPLVQDAFAHGAIDRSWLSFADFENDLQHALDHPDAAPRLDQTLTPFGDTVAELSSWYCFQPQPASRAEGGTSSSPGMPVLNPLRKIGRNDLCPCGSGKKFKKCCLGIDTQAALN
jgi:hypothetical protein